MTELGVSRSPATSDVLAGSEWEIVAIDGAAVPTVAPVAIAFDHDGRVSGSTGVNHLTASYSVTAEYLTFGPLATSRRAGAPDRMELEHRVLGSLAGMCPFYLSAHTLWIDGPMGRIELIRRSAPSDPRITG